MSVKLNLGCFDKRIPGFVNIDFDPAVVPDLVCDVTRLPFEDDYVDLIWASHILEHLPYESEALTEWHRVLKPGGTIIVAVPELFEEYFLLSRGIHTVAQFNGAVFGGCAMGGPEKTQSHKQAFMLGMLVARMAPLFPDAHTISGCEVRERFWGEDMVQGTKP